MKCGHCLVNRRIAGLEKTGEEPDLRPRKGDGLPPVFDAITVFHGIACCAVCFVQSVTLKRHSPLATPTTPVEPHTSGLLLPAGAVA